MAHLRDHTHFRQQDMMTRNLALIIEDETPLQIIYARSVAAQGYETLVACNGREALELLQLHTPILIFLDMLLPFVNGVDILNRIITEPRFQNTHIVLMSSNSEFSRYQHCCATCEFHLKPLLPSHIQTIVGRLNKPLASKAN